MQLQQLKDAVDTALRNGEAPEAEVHFQEVGGQMYVVHGVHMEPHGDGRAPMHFVLNERDPSAG